MNTPTAALLTANERESFFAAQARHRAGALRWSIAMAAVVAAIALTISLLLAPLGYALIGLLVDLLNLIVPMPDLLGRFGRAIDAVLNADKAISLSQIVTLAAVAAIPGAVALALAWRRLGRIFGAHHVEALHAELGLRDAQSLDFEEQQLGNLVEEISLAAGRSAPRLKLLDSDVCNIGLLGDGEGAALIVTRGLLDRLDRAQTQALIGQAIAALGDGDGVLAQRLLRLNAVMGLLMLLAQAPLSKAARTALRPLLGFHRSADSARDIGILKSVLTDPLSLADGPDGIQAERTWREWAMMPLMGSVMIGILIVPVTTLLFVAPLGGLVWRRRRLLADAMAVQFTRDPQALAEAYAALAQLPTGFGLKRGWLGDLFVVDTQASSTLRVGSPYPKLGIRIERLNAMGARVDVPKEAKRMPEWAWLVAVPVCGVLAVLFGLLIYLGVFVSLALSSLFLVIPTAALHALLRHFGHA